MSMTHWTESGYGVPLGNDINKILDFILSNTDRSFSEEEIKEIRKAENINEIGDFFDCQPAEEVASIISKLENVKFFRGYESCGDTDQECMIGFEPVYPWSYLESDNVPSRAECDRIISKYSKVLGITVTPDFFDAYYFG